MINPNDLRTAEFLIQSSLQELYLKWAATQPLRSGLHASSLLVSQNEWCTRRYVLAELHPEEVERPELHYWDWRMQSVFENGWDLHRRWQKLFKQFADTVVTFVEYGPADIRYEPELDRTHHDETRNIYFSPDAIIDYAGVRYVVEIKGINHDEYTGHPELYEREFHNGAYRYVEAQEARKGVKDCITIEEAMEVSQTVHKAFYQAQLYMHLLELQYAIILVENKNTQEFKTWVIEYNSEMAIPYIQRAYDVKGRVALFRRSRQLPERVCKSSDDRLAQKCPMRNCCFSKEMEG